MRVSINKCVDDPGWDCGKKSREKTQNRYDVKAYSSQMVMSNTCIITTG